MSHIRIKSDAQQGWTLIELLVAMTLSLLVIAGIGQIYLAAKRSYDIQTNLAQIQDVGRYVTELLTQDIRRAGHWGLMNINAATLAGDSLPAFNCTNATWGNMIRQKIFGLDDTSTGYGTCINRLRGDVLTIRYADPTPVTTFDPINDANRLFIRTTPYSGTVSVGPPTTPNPPSFFSDYALVAHTYYVANSTSAGECGQSGPPWLPSLDQEYLDANGNPRMSELVTGVENLQFQYGVDTDSPPDNSVNRYLNAIDVTNGNLWDQVRAVRFWVLVRASCQESDYTDTTTYQLGDVPPYTPNDHYRRELYSSTVALRN